MEYYGNNDYRDYLAHYGRKGMRKGKHLPGVILPDGRQKINFIAPNGQRVTNDFHQATLHRGGLQRRKKAIPSDLEASEMRRDNQAMSDRKKKEAHRKSKNTAFNKIGLTREESRKYYSKDKKNLSRKERNTLKAKATFSDIRDGYKLSKEQRRNKNIKKAKRMIYMRLGYRPKTRID